MSEADARARLEEQGFVVETATTAGNGIPRNFVVYVNANNPQLVRGSTVTMYLSDGSAPRPRNTSPRDDAGRTTPSDEDQPAPVPEPAPAFELPPEAEQAIRDVEDFLNSL